jgi:serine/threonine-protein kinase
MSTDPVTSFIDQLRGSQILDVAQFEEVERLRQMARQPAELARELIKRGWLTPHQANQVARGRSAELVLGSYLILGPLGSGGMGQVVRARHRFLHQDRALKIIRPDRSDGPDTVQRFEREVQLLARLRHPHIVQAHDAGHIGDVWFLAMELLEGCDLDQLVQQRGPLPVAEACAYVRQAALGLHHAHQQGLVHRDIKPSNLFLTAEGIKVLDLGLARPQKLADALTAADLTRANTVMGTPDYLAPEQALDPRKADARTDLYSLGCTFYYLLTGRPPFPDGSLAQKLLWHQNAEPQPVESWRPDAPPVVAELVHQMLAKKSEDRPATALAVAVALAPVAAQAPAAAPSISLAGAPNPDRGWTISTETMPPRATPPIERAATIPPRAATPADTARTIPPRAAAPVESAMTIPPRPAPRPAPGDVLPGGTDQSWVLKRDSLPPAPAAPSLIDARSDVVESGFTLATESLPPTPTPLMPLRPRAAHPGSILSSETLIPTAGRPAPATIKGPRGLPRWWLLAVAGVVGGAGGLLILVVFVLAIIFWPWRGTAPAQPPDKDKKGQQEIVAISKKGQPEKKAEQPPKKAKVEVKEDLPKFLEPLGPNELPDLPTKPFAVDPQIAGQDPGSKVFLSDMQEFAYRIGEPTFRFGKNGLLGDGFRNSRIRIKGKDFPKGLGTAPGNQGYTRVCYALGKRAKSLHGAAAFSEFWHNRTPQPVRFVVLGDGKVLWRSQILRVRAVPEDFVINVFGIDILELRVYTTNGWNDSSHAAWLDPYVIVGATPRNPAASRDAVKPPPLQGERWSGADLAIPVHAFDWVNSERLGTIPRENLRAVQVNDQTGTLRPTSPLWAHLAREVAQKRWGRSPLVNGRWGKNPFLEVPEEGALLIGFCCDHGLVMGYVQPIFLTAIGEKLGQAYGRPAPQVHCVKARPGYAVGQITVRSGDLFDGMGLTFMKVHETGLDTQDSYASPWLGSKGGATLVIGGDGNFIVGIHG